MMGEVDPSLDGFGVVPVPCDGVGWVVPSVDGVVVDPSLDGFGSAVVPCIFMGLGSVMTDCCGDCVWP